jgi:hypothetical protein
LFEKPPMTIGGFFINRSGTAGLLQRIPNSHFHKNRMHLWIARRLLKKRAIASVDYSTDRRTLRHVKDTVLSRA